MHDAFLSCRDLVHMDEFLFSRGQVDSETIGFAVPALPGGFVDAQTQIGFDVDEAGRLFGVGT
jgi:hypothetical protein